ncbi:MAG: hypothetical protein MUP85_11050 [Candidatus Lokiarchaeota archaeon]|jgi:hypothetical protein|nr:hypothetical protein [Candidatus Lokiarchaeota archaeon]
MILSLMQINEFEIPSITLWVLAWIFLLIGIFSVVVLILYTKYGRELSMKLTILSIVFSSVFLGFATHFFLTSIGI